MHLTFKLGRPVNLSGLTMAWSISVLQCSSWNWAKQTKDLEAWEHVNKRVSTTEFNKVSNGNVQFSCDPRSAEVRFYIIITEQWLAILWKMLIILNAQI